MMSHVHVLSMLTMFSKPSALILLITVLSTWNIAFTRFFCITGTQSYLHQRGLDDIDVIVSRHPNVSASASPTSTYQSAAQTVHSHSTSESSSPFAPSPTAPIRFLWGIPSVAHDYKRRQLVRETYLSFYKSTSTPNRICSLFEFLNDKASLLGDHNGTDAICEITYVFFIGGNETGPTELTKPNASHPMLIHDYHYQTNASEDDVVSLNIRENLEDGKSQTWFKYASMVVKDRPSLFDYIAKVDVDALVFPPPFLQFARRKLPRWPHNHRVYGGLPHDKNACNPNEDNPHSCPLDLKGDLYMAGSLYWMSPDLADYIASDEVDRESLSIRHEDVDVGNFIFSHPLPIQTITIDNNRALNHRNYDMGWRKKTRSETFRGVLFGHSEDGFFPGPFFKSPRIYRKMWRHFQGFWQSKTDDQRHRPTNTVDIYRLYDVVEKKENQTTPLSRQLAGSTAAWEDAATMSSSSSSTQSSSSSFTFTVQPNDYIYSDSDFDSSPIVIESHKLIFFTVAGVADNTWRRLFRRMMGYTNWTTDDVDTFQQSNGNDGLRRLYDYSIEEASTMLSSPDYTRAFFVRNARSRLLAAYLDKVVEGDSSSSSNDVVGDGSGDGHGRVPYMLKACCGGPASCNYGKSLPHHCRLACNNNATMEFSMFLTVALQICDQPWWRPLSRQMEPRFYSALNYVGRYQTMAKDAQDLLQRIGAWEDFGRSGWGPSGNESIFHDTHELQDEVVQKYYKSKAARKHYAPFQVYNTHPESYHQIMQSTQ